MNEAPAPADRDPEPPRRGRLIPERYDWATGWIQALVAVLTLGLAAITAWGLFGTGRSEPTAAPTPPPSAAVAESVLALTGTTPEGSAIVFLGTFRNVDLATQGIFMVGRPPGAEDELFAILEAEITPLRTFPVNLADGEWRIVRPGEYASYGFKLLVYSGAFGAGDVFKDLRENGPEADDVEAVIDVPGD